MAKRFKTVEAVDPAILEEAKAFPVVNAPKALARPSVTKDFLFAGNAHIVVSNPTKETFTYAIRAREGKGRFAGQKTFFMRVKAAGGRFPYRYVGIAKPEGILIPQGKSEFQPGSKEFDVAAWAVKMIVDETSLAVGYSIRHDNTCGQCNRTLTGEADRVRGFDEMCWKTLHKGEGE